MKCPQKGHADNQIGCVRIITIDGHQFTEQLEALDDLEHTQYVTLGISVLMKLQWQNSNLVLQSTRACNMHAAVYALLYTVLTPLSG